MLQEIISLALLTHLVDDIIGLRVCVPNTYFILNNRLCYCNYEAAWSEANCTDITRNQLCQSGQVIWDGCKRCVCQENKRLICTNVFCQNNMTNYTIFPQTALFGYSPNCLPFQSYYVNCSLCLCPASGKSLDAQCVFDSSCTLHSYLISDIASVLKRNQCISNVMYLYPCTQCFCSEYGFFDLDKCIQRCEYSNQLVQKCKPGTLYRNDCEVCRCSDNGTRDRNLCIKSDCTKNSQDKHVLRSSSVRCTPRTFTSPRCLFCECNFNGTVNDTACLELSCSTMSYLRYGKTDKCRPGELVSACIECFCLSNGFTNGNYCTRSCTYASKVKILEKILNQSPVDMSIIDKTKIDYIRSNDPCRPNSLYISNRRYCLCSNNAKQLYCTSIFEEIKMKTKQVESIKKININTTCEPNTLVDFDCNTCYCSKKGKIDPKWCTYDDCEAKRLVQESHKSDILHASDEDENGACSPGSISKVKCNYCICPESGLLQERACTKTHCFNSIDVTNYKFTCEPLAYYEVDCNICYCPRDGLKNVDKCTKNQCEKNFLRVDSCVPGHLFSDMCNVCVCPPNGDKEDKVCTNHTCDISPWNMFKISDNLLNNEIQDDTVRSLDRCIPGEEFVMDCDLCVCSDLGLKSYSTCEPLLCEDIEDRRGRRENNSLEYKKNLRKKNNYYSSNRPQKSKRVRRYVDTDCFTYNISQSAERHDCTPGTMYIIRCRECICPYKGNINNFCRPLPKNVYCEQPYPGFNFLPMGRRHVNDSRLSIKSNATIKVSVKHLKHTVYQCQTPGQVEDDCFICECNNGTVILEHCYESDAESCENKKPSFLFNKPTTN